MIHDLLSATECTNGQTTTDDLSKGHQVGLNIVTLLGTTTGQAESRHHFIKNQNDVVFSAELSESLQKLLFGRNTPHISCNRLQDDRRNLPLIFTHQCLDTIQIVDIGNERISGRAFGDAGTVGSSERQCTASGLDQK